MDTKARLKPSDELTFSITIDASVGNWRHFIRELTKLHEEAARPHRVWPISGIMTSVESMLEKLDRTYNAHVNEPERE